MKRFPLLGAALALLCMSIAAPAAEPVDQPDVVLVGASLQTPIPMAVTELVSVAFVVPTAIDDGIQRGARVDLSPEATRSDPMTVRCKVVCTSKHLSDHQKSDGTTVKAAQITFAGAHKALGPNDQGLPEWTNAIEENRSFGEATPSLSFSMYVVNPAAHEQIEQGGSYYLDITPTRET